MRIASCSVEPMDKRRTPEELPEEPGFYESLGRAVKVLRTARGLERKRLAEAAGISYPYLAEIENGKKRPSSKALLLISQALRIRPHELLESAERLAEPIEPEDRGEQWGADEYLLALGQAPPYEAASGRAVLGDTVGAASEVGMRSASRETLRRDLSALLSKMSEEDLERMLDLAGRLLGLPTRSRSRPGRWLPPEPGARAPRPARRR